MLRFGLMNAINTYLRLKFRVVVEKMVSNVGITAFWYTKYTSIQVNHFYQFFILQVPKKYGDAYVVRPR